MLGPRKEYGDDSADLNGNGMKRREDDAKRAREEYRKNRLKQAKERDNKVQNVGDKIQNHENNQKQWADDLHNILKNYNAHVFVRGDDDFCNHVLDSLLKHLRKMPGLYCKPGEDATRADLVKCVATVEAKEYMDELEEVGSARDVYMPHIKAAAAIKLALSDEQAVPDDILFLREEIAHAESDERIAELANQDAEAFVEKYDMAPEEGELVVSYPNGDVVMGPGMVMAAPRAAKSWPAVAMAILFALMESHILWSVAPDRTVVLAEILKKFKLSGCEAAAVMTVRESGKEEDTEDLNFNCFVYSSDEKKDVEQYARRAKFLKENGRFMVHFHDEADTMIKDGGTLETIKQFFPTSNGYRILIGATMLPVFQEMGLFGTLTTDEAANMSDYAYPTCPVRPATTAQYVSIEETKAVEYDAAPFWVYTKARVLRRAKLIAESTRTSSLARAQANLAVARARDVDDAGASYNKRLKTRTREARVAARVAAVFKWDTEIQKLEAAREKMAAGDFSDVVKEADADDPFLPTGLADYGKNAVATAKIEIFWEKILHDPATVRVPGVVDRFLNQMLVCAPSEKIRETKTGGAAKWAARLCDIAYQLQKPVAVLVYASGVTKNNVPAHFSKFKAEEDWKITAKLPVKLLEVRRVVVNIVDSDDDPVYRSRMHRCNVKAFADSEAAFSYLHDHGKSGLTPEDVKKTHVACIGYNMFKAATTLSNDRTLEIQDNQDPSVVRTERILYSPKYMVLAHVPKKQLNILFQMFGRALNQFQNFSIPDYKVLLLSHKETLPMLTVYAKGEEMLRELLFKAGKGKIDEDGHRYTYYDIIARIKAFWDEQNLWDGDITKQLLGLRRVKVSKQLENHNLSQEVRDEMDKDFDMLEEEEEEENDEVFEDDDCEDYCRPPSGVIDDSWDDDDAKDAEQKKKEECPVKVGPGTAYESLDPKIWQPVLQKFWGAFADVHGGGQTVATATRGAQGFARAVNALAKVPWVTPHQIRIDASDIDSTLRAIWDHPKEYEDHIADAVERNLLAIRAASSKGGEKGFSHMREKVVAYVKEVGIA
tara:strand:+ start:7024 stop:10191 length:3168 start_codon:yes stop_codon:yes gene_type:complete